MVPSWTETLIEAGAEVVARTRFCVHPEAAVTTIAAVGGTKNIDWQKLVATQAELLILDRDENPLAMAEASPVPFWASEIRCVDDVAPALRELSGLFENSGDAKVARGLHDFAQRWDDVLRKFRQVEGGGRRVPAVIEWLRRPPNEAHVMAEKIVYLIWKDPFMAASAPTFIGSMLTLFGLELEPFSIKYPAIDLATYDAQTTLLLFSSEPYPFAKMKSELTALPFASALVDGESLSWFGVRSLRFLEACV